MNKSLTQRVGVFLLLICVLFISANVVSILLYTTQVKHNTFSYSYWKRNIMNTRYTWSKSEKNISHLIDLSNTRNPYALWTQCIKIQSMIQLFSSWTILVLLFGKHTYIFRHIDNRRKTYTPYSILSIDVKECWKKVNLSNFDINSGIYFFVNTDNRRNKCYQSVCTYKYRTTFLWMIFHASKISHTIIRDR